MFTRKHFNACASLLMAQVQEIALIDDRVAFTIAIKHWHGVATQFRDMFADSNPRFDHEAFNDASGITSAEFLHGESIFGLTHQEY